MGHFNIIVNISCLEKDIKIINMIKICNIISYYRALSVLFISLLASFQDKGFIFIYNIPRRVSLK